MPLNSQDSPFLAGGLVCFYHYDTTEKLLTSLYQASFLPRLESFCFNITQWEIYLVYCAILSILYGTIMIFPFVGDLDNDRKVSFLPRYPGSKQFPGRKHQSPIIKFESKFNKCIFESVLSSV